MITRAIKNCLRHAKERGWEKTYWAIDIHGTILKPNYKTNEISREFYPGALEALRLLGKRKDIVKILYTCSYPHEIEQYVNPEVIDGAYGYYNDKFYFNVLMDDKAGFDGETDWTEIYKIMNDEKI
jgi:hypothetical protein